MRMRYPRFVFLSVLFILVLAGSVAAATVTLTTTPQPSIDVSDTRAMATSDWARPLLTGKSPGPALTPGLIGPAIECFDFNDNPTFNGGYLFIPPDPIDAAGLEHVINIGNCIIEWRPKAALMDTPQYINSLDGFFAGTPGALPLGIAPTNVFDPKVTYDQYRDRFIVVALQRVSSPTLESRILVAVSKTSDPNAGWWLHSINSTLTIGGVARWADYPGLGLDDDAVYITANMFNAAGTTYGGSRLWIIQKGPTYSGPNGSISSAVYDPYGLTGAGSFATTTQPTHMWGPEPANVGTFLVSYSGLSDGTNEYLDIIRVDGAAAVPSFNFQQFMVGNFDNTAVGLPDSPQLGSAALIEVNDRRALSAVWRNNNLYISTTVLPVAGPDVNQTTAHWFRVSTVNLGALFAADHGDVGAEDLGTATYTFFPAIHVDMCDNMAIGFSACNQSMYCGAYYALRALGDPAGTIQNTSVLALGTDYYLRTFGGSRNRWGDYSGLSLCPSDQSTFYVYNEYACTRGTPTGTEDGRWCTKLGKFSLCQPVSVAITSFSARYDDGAVTIRSTFRSDMGVEAVNVYRAVGNGDLQRVDEIFGADGRGFVYADRGVESGNTYRYQIGIMDADGEFLSPVEEVSVPKVAVSLGQNTPNPFNPTTMINFTLASRGHVTVSVYDANGRLVRTLVDDTRAAGTHDVQWDGRDDAGVTVGSGVYFYRLTAGNHTESKKMVMLK